jgi:hypothetical protein
MTFITEVGTGMVKTAAKLAAPTAKTTVAAAVPTIAKEAIGGTKTLVEPVKALRLVGKESKPVFEATRKPLGEFGKGIASPITARVLESVPSDARLSLLARGFFSKANITETGTHAPTLTSSEIQSLVRTAGITLPEDVLKNPVFTQKFSDAFQNRLLSADQNTFTLDKTVLRSLRDTLKDWKDADDLEKLKRQAAKQAIRKRMIAWRKSITGDPRFKDHPDEEKEALRKVWRYEQRLLLEVDIRFTFGKNIITDTIGDVLTDPKAA